MGIRFLHLADLHLGSHHPHLGDKAEGRAREVLESFRGAIGFALDPENAIDAVVIAGNLFDRHRPDPETWAFTRGLLGRAIAAKKPVVVIPGARDSLSYKDSVFRTERWPGIDLITATRSAAPLRWEIRGTPVFVYGVAACAGHSSECFSGFSRLAEDGIHLGVLNASLEDHPESEVRPRDQRVSEEAIAASGLDYLALGGFHGFTPLHAGGVTAAYPGTLEGRRFEVGDLGPKSLLVVDIDPETRAVTLEQHPASRRRLEDLAIHLGDEVITDAQALAGALISRGGEEVIARVTLTGPLEFLCDLEKVAEAAGEHFHHLELVDRTDLLGSTLLRRLESENTIRGFFVRRMLQRLASLGDRAATAAEDAPVHRDLAVARRALRLGLEQFLDEEAPPVLGETSHAPEAASAAKPSRRAEPSIAGLAEAAASAGRNGSNGSGHSPQERERALIRAGRGFEVSDSGGDVA